MRRILVVIALCLPSLVLMFFFFQPQADLTFNLPLFHFYIVTFTTFSAAVISILLVSALAGVAQIRHVLAAAAFAVMGSVFFSHGLATPNAFIDYAHPAVQWSAWLTFFGGGVLFALAGFDGPHGPPRWLQVRKISYAAVGGVILYSAIAAFAPGWLDFIDAQASPWFRTLLFGLTLGIWSFAAYRLWRIWRLTHNRVDGALASLACLLAQATVSMFIFPVWHLSWWLYHSILLVSFLFTASILVVEYEQARQFRLWRYYLAVSLILTALMALVASSVFAELSYRALVDRIKVSTTGLVENLTSEIAHNLPVNAESTELFAIYANRLSAQSIGSVTLYDPAGNVVYPLESKPQLLDEEDRTFFEQALAGQTVVNITPPNIAPAGYAPASSVYVIDTYALLYPPPATGDRPLGVLDLAQESPELGQLVLYARATSLGLVAVTMGLLFGALLLVVRKADRIITIRSQQLQAEQEKSEKLLLNILPAPIATRLKNGQRIIVDSSQETTVLFADVVGFTRYASTVSPETLIDHLNTLIERFDKLVEKYGLEKIKTSGDAYMVVSGAPLPRLDHAEAIADFALDIQADLAASGGDLATVRIGIHTGPVVAGVIGTKKFAYDIWGDTVNVASRMESTCPPGSIQVTAEVYRRLQNRFTFEPRGLTPVKGKSDMETYLLIGRK